LVISGWLVVGLMHTSAETEYKHFHTHLIFQEFFKVLKALNTLNSTTVPSACIHHFQPFWRFLNASWKLCSVRACDCTYFSVTFCYVKMAAFQFCLQPGEQKAKQLLALEIAELRESFALDALWESSERLIEGTLQKKNAVIHST
jgi:hypothetical protein